MTIVIHIFLLKFSNDKTSFLELENSVLKRGSWKLRQRDFVNI